MAIIDSFLRRGILVSPEIAEDPVLINKLSLLNPDSLDDVDMIDKDFLLSLEKNKDVAEFGAEDYKIIFSYSKKPGKINVVDFVSYFNRRFEGLSQFLRQRAEFQGTVSINRLKAKKDRENVSVIGLVFEVSVTKKNSIMITLEDPTGTINVLVRPDKKDLYAQAKEIVLDELIGVEGTISNGYIFANNIVFPEVPSIKELKKSPDEEYVAFIGDMHVGSNLFLKKEFQDFLEWLNLKKGNEEQKSIASKIKYLIFTGDLVEGVGIYPRQEDDLVIKDIRDQYAAFAELIKEVPPHIKMFVCPGNHDVGRLSEPQQPITYDYAPALKEFPNLILLSNPSIIRLGIKKNFPGFDFLIYHGYSMIYYADKVESIRNKGGQKRPDLIMKFLLQKRHLAPSHTSNLYIPDTEVDPLIIQELPDFFVTGHIHRLSVSQYRNITLLNCSCWSDGSEEQEKRGLEPQPGKLPIVNLKTREVKVINFLKEKKEDAPADEESASVQKEQSGQNGQKEVSA